MKTLVQKKPILPSTPSPSSLLVPPRGGLDARLRTVEAPVAPGAAHDFGGISIHPPARAGTAGSGGEDVLRTARWGVEGAGAPLPHLGEIQGAFGRHDLSEVRARVGGRAAAAGERIGAAAYATGGSAAFRERPTLWTAAHEAAHVVQQRAGLRLDGGVGRAGDRHERHAEAVADRVSRGRSAESLLDAYAPAASGASRDAVQKQDAPPSLTAHHKKGTLSVYEYKEGAKTVWIDPYKILFLGGLGYDVFAWAKEKKGYSTFAALFIVAHATLESDFGRGNYGAEYKNLFSLMGGPPGNKGTAHGRLMKFPTYEAGQEAYAARMAAKWPDAVTPGTGLYFRSSFTPDELNRAFHQYTYYNVGGQVYLGNPASDYGAELFERMEFIAGPLIVLIDQKIAENVHAFAFAFEQQLGASDPVDQAMWKELTKLYAEVLRKLRLFAGELTAARAEAKARLAEHVALKKAGKIGPKKP